MFRGLDHIAILVANTEEALTFYRDKLGFPVIVSEVVNGGVARLTHLNMGNTQLQLVEPLEPSHPLHAQLLQQGEGLHHLCFAVESVEASMEALTELGLEMAQTNPHQGTQGKRAAFLAKSSTRGVIFEITGR